MENEHQNRNCIHLVEITTFLIFDENISDGQTDGRAEGRRDMRLHQNPFYEIIYSKASILTDWGRDGRRDRQTDRWMGKHTDGQTDRQRDGHRNELGRTDEPSCSDWVTHKDDSMDFWPFVIFAFKGCSWRPIPAHPWCARWHTNESVEFASWGAFNW